MAVDWMATNVPDGREEKEIVWNDMKTVDIVEESEVLYQLSGEKI